MVVILGAVISIIILAFVASILVRLCENRLSQNLPAYRGLGWFQSRLRRMHQNEISRLRLLASEAKNQADRLEREWGLSNE